MPTVAYLRCSTDQDTLRHAKRSSVAGSKSTNGSKTTRS